LNSKKIKVYLAAPIVNYYNSELTLRVGKILEKLDLEITSPWVLSGKDISISSEDIFHRDINAVKNSDILLAEVSHPSHGVGMELMQAYIMNKKIIMVAHINSNISYLVKGIPNSILLEYEDYKDLEEKLKNLLIKEVKR